MLKLSQDYLNVLMLGDIIGSPGIKQLLLKLDFLKKKEKIHFTIANCENSDNGFGVTEETVSSIKSYGVDVLTSGNHIWSNSDAGDLLAKYDFLIRPANYPKAPGKGFWSGEINGVSISVINLLGRYFMIPIDCPFQTLSKLLKQDVKKNSIIIVDFHAELYQEKIALALDFDGEITFLAGTHTHVLTADEKILPKGTGYITDLGMCGGLDGIIGMKKEEALAKMINQTVNPYIPAEENPVLQGVVIKVDVNTKKTVEIKRISL